MLKNISSLAENFKSKITTNLNNAFDDITSSYEAMQPVPTQELFQFLELSIDAQTDNYLRQLALLAAHSDSIAETSKRLQQQIQTTQPDSSNTSEKKEDLWLLP